MWVMVMAMFMAMAMVMVVGGGLVMGRVMAIAVARATVRATVRVAVTARVMIGQGMVRTGLLLWGCGDGSGMVAGMVTGRVQVLYRYGYVKVEGVDLGCVHSTVIVTDCCG